MGARGLEGVTGLGRRRQPKEADLREVGAASFIFISTEMNLAPLKLTVICPFVS